MAVVMNILSDGIVTGYGVLLSGMKNDTAFREAGYSLAKLTLPNAVNTFLTYFLSKFSKVFYYALTLKVDLLFLNTHYWADMCHGE